MVKPNLHDKAMLRIAEGRGNLGKVKNRTLTWLQLRREMTEPTRTKERLKTFLKLPKEEQDKLKNINGWWIGGHCADGRRARASITERDIITFDCDEMPAKMLRELIEGKTGISKYEFFLHTSRKHQPTAPRTRLVFLLKTPIAADDYEAASRVLASKLDPSMDAVDDVTFRVAQMMFKPSCSLDSDYVFHHNPGEKLDVYAMLDDFGDWHDHAKLPFSERQGQKRRSSKKAENPLEKPGIIGAFCRTYDVEQAIEEFLSDIYTIGDPNSAKPRYTYSDGSTTNGAVVEDDGLFLYSHHTSDPCSDRLVNSFDLVRIHKFGSLDEKGEEENAKSPSDLKSFKKMIEFAQDDQKVRKELAQEKYDLIAMFDDLSQEDEEPYDEYPNDSHNKSEGFDDDVELLLGKPGKPKKKKDNQWFTKLDINENGQIKSTISNIVSILSNDLRFDGLIGYNELYETIVCRKPVSTRMEYVEKIHVLDRVNGDVWTDMHDAMVRAILESPNGKGQAGYGLVVSDRNLDDSILLVAEKNKFNPVKRFFENLQWDGKRRLFNCLQRYLGVEDNPYVREAFTLFMIAAVTRTFEPGHKFDTALILEGETQGAGKSTFLKILAKDAWFGELSGDFGNTQKMVEQTLGFLILEMPELSTLRKSEVDDTKRFISTQRDTVRMAYDRRAKTIHRRFVLSGSTNEREYLKDPTGNRRFWPIKTHLKKHGLRMDDLIGEVDQLWAEAVTAYRDMRKVQPKGTLPLFIQGKRAREFEASAQQASRLETEEDSMAGEIVGWLEDEFPLSQITGEIPDDNFDNPDGEPMGRRTVVCLTQIWEEALGRDRKFLNRVASYSLSRAMSMVPGWEKSDRQVRFPGYGKQRAWIREDATEFELSLRYRPVDDTDETDYDIQEML